MNATTFYLTGDSGADRKALVCRRHQSVFQSVSVKLTTFLEALPLTESQRLYSCLPLSCPSPLSRLIASSCVCQSKSSVSVQRHTPFPTDSLIPLTTLFRANFLTPVLFPTDLHSIQHGNIPLNHSLPVPLHLLQIQGYNAITGSP